MALETEDLLLIAAGGLVLYAASQLVGGSSDGGRPPETPADVPPTMDDLIRQLYASDAEVSRVVGDVDDSEPDWLLSGDFRDAQFYRQMWLPASRISLAELTPADLALAIVFLGCVPDAPRLPKGSAGGCPITKFEAAIAKVNAKFQSEADAAKGVGQFLNVVASIFGVDTKEFDKSSGLGRASTEIMKAKFDLTQLQGVAIGDLKKALAWDTPLQRPTLQPPPQGMKVTISTKWIPRFYEVRCSEGGQVQLAQGNAQVGKGSGIQAMLSDQGWVFMFTKAGQVFLSARGGEVAHNQTGKDAGLGSGQYQGDGTLTNCKWVDKEQGIVVQSETRPDLGPCFRAGLFQLEQLTNKPSAGTIDHTSAFSDYGEWALPWNSPQLGCAGTLRQRIYKRARIYRAIDFLACRMFPVDPAQPVTRAPWGTKTLDYFYGPGGVYLLGGPPKLYFYTTNGGVEMRGSIFPPNEPAIVIGKGDGAPRVVTAPGGSTADVQKVTAAAAPAPARSTSGAAPAPAPVAAPKPPAKIMTVSRAGTLAGRIIATKTST